LSATKHIHVILEHKVGGTDKWRVLSMAWCDTSRIKDVLDLFVERESANSLGLE